MFGLHLVVAEAPPVTFFAVCLSSVIGALIAHFLAGSKLQQGFAVVSMGVSVWMIIRLFWMG
ncbi:MAG: hypothetical protein Q8M57_10345 [Nitrosomonas sp.]|uniref:hypothetical protein n=1 Tax=Nitrosomonas sp. TaxID=42353 RepID=UPI002720BE4A|nr:hypothetical protein [Nitrosomonas sp.]MDO8894843.1 hypothetical protein [Nitrosomonas sp.]MDP3281426.1 hypothetical protein [Nitrosomonas sp.]MDP3664659.1 hypothetical protein [Nitrosomonas sp.]